MCWGDCDLQTGLYGPRTGEVVELSLNHTVFADVFAGTRKKFAITVPPQAPELAGGGCISVTLTCMDRPAGTWGYGRPVVLVVSTRGGESYVADADRPSSQTSARAVGHK